MRVIARAYEDEPLDRLAVGYSQKLVYIVDQSTISSAKDDADAGVGFPADCVFEYDPNLLASLLAAYAADDRGRLYELWSRATPFRSDATLAA
jgi:hypothetical protein